MRLPIKIVQVLIFLIWCTSATCQSEWHGVDRIVAIGDLHGDYDQYLLLLKENNLINKKLRWRGGDTHLVQLGDIPDRGPDSFKIIHHLRKLQKQALKSGGRVHPLIGNHEAMNIQGDLRYVHPGEYEIHVNRRSKNRQSKYINQVLEKLIAQNPELNEEINKEINEENEILRSKLYQRFPLGYVEHRILWESGGKISDWVTRNNTVIKINSTLFVHGGLNPHIPPLSLEKINQTIQSELKDVQVIPDGLSNAEDGPLWYRGLAINSKEEELAALEEMLKYYKAEKIVIGHTPLAGAIIPRLNGKVIVSDVGISAYYGSGRANIVIENNQLKVLHRGQAFDMPKNDEEIIKYLTNLKELELESSPLESYIQKLKKKQSVQLVQ